MNIERAIMLIEKEQQELAVAALRSPNSRDAFEYGRVSGVYAGLERAKEVLISTIVSKEDDDV